MRYFKQIFKDKICYGKIIKDGSKSHYVVDVGIDDPNWDYYSHLAWDGYEIIIISEEEYLTALVIES